MNKLYKIASIVLCVALLLTLCACGSEENQGNSGTNQQNTPITNQSGAVDDIAPEDRPAVPADLEYTVSEYLATGETIWYMIDENEGKDSFVKRIFVIEPNGTLYTMNNVRRTLGELEQMDDVDIAAMVKTEYAKQCVDYYESYMETDREETLNSLKQGLIVQEVFETAIYVPVTELLASDPGLIFDEAYYEDIVSVLTLWENFMRKHGTSEELLLSSSYMLCEPQSALRDWIVSMVSEGEITEEGAEALKAVGQAYEDLCNAFYDSKCAEIEAFIDTVQPCPYKLVIVTDSTGNNTSYMELVYQTTKIGGHTNIDAQPLSYIYPAGQNNGNSNTVIYDSLYGGYYNDGDYLFTRVSDDVHFMLDAVGTYDLPIDVKDYESLFD